MRTRSAGTFMALIVASCRRRTIDSGVLRGKNSPIQLLASKPSRPCSCAVGTCGSTAALWRASTASGLTVPALICGSDGIAQVIDAAGDQILQRGRRHPIWHMLHVYADRAVEQHATEMSCGTAAARTERKFRRIGIDVIGEAFQRIRVDLAGLQFLQCRRLIDHHLFDIDPEPLEHDGAGEARAGAGRTEIDLLAAQLLKR